jgi:hypothetical protein
MIELGGYGNLDAAFVGHSHEAAGEMFNLGQEKKIAVVGGTYKLYDTFRKRWVGDTARGGFTVVLWPDKKDMMLFRDPIKASEYLLGRIALLEE